MKIQNSKFKIQNSNRGVSLYLSLTVMAILLAISLGLASILVAQIGMVRGIGYSVIAFNAADTGIERVLMNKENPTSTSSVLLPNGASYQVFVHTTSTDPSCTASHYCIKSVGTYRGVKRAIEISY